MAVELNHTIVPASDPLASARFLAPSFWMMTGNVTVGFRAIGAVNSSARRHDCADAFRSLIPLHPSGGLTGRRD